MHRARHRPPQDDPPRHLRPRRRSLPQLHGQRIRPPRVDRLSPRGQRLVLRARTPPLGPRLQRGAPLQVHVEVGPGHAPGRGKVHLLPPGHPSVGRPRPRDGQGHRLRKRQPEPLRLQLPPHPVLHRLPRRHLLGRQVQVRARLRRQGGRRPGPHPLGRRPPVAQSRVDGQAVLPPALPAGQNVPSLPLLRAGDRRREGASLGAPRPGLSGPPHNLRSVSTGEH
mmetsp:Transcript_1013/g.2892  ORF Transcript_1013/g.2892 Transcript_1013/m.2892 type:complete len:224 (-) Transcript_1013:1038-1709(-)